MNNDALSTYHGDPTLHRKTEQDWLRSTRRVRNNDLRYGLTAEGGNVVPLFVDPVRATKSGMNIAGAARAQALLRVAALKDVFRDDSADAIAQRVRIRAVIEISNVFACNKRKCDARAVAAEKLDRCDLHAGWWTVGVHKRVRILLCFCFRFDPDARTVTRESIIEVARASIGVAACLWLRRYGKTCPAFCRLEDALRKRADEARLNAVGRGDFDILIF